LDYGKEKEIRREDNWEWERKEGKGKGVKENGKGQRETGDREGKWESFEGN